MSALTAPWRYRFVTPFGFVPSRRKGVAVRYLLGPKGRGFARLPSRGHGWRVSPPCPHRAPLAAIGLPQRGELPKHQIQGLGFVTWRLVRAASGGREPSRLRCRGVTSTDTLGVVVARRKVNPFWTPLQTLVARRKESYLVRIPSLNRTTDRETLPLINNRTILQCRQETDRVGLSPMR